MTSICCFTLLRLVMLLAVSGFTKAIEIPCDPWAGAPVEANVTDVDLNTLLRTRPTVGASSNATFLEITNHATSQRCVGLIVSEPGKTTLITVVSNTTGDSSDYFYFYNYDNTPELIAVTAAASLPGKYYTCNTSQCFIRFDSDQQDAGYTFQFKVQHLGNLGDYCAPDTPCLPPLVCTSNSTQRGQTCQLPSQVSSTTLTTPASTTLSTISTTVSMTSATLLTTSISTSSTTSISTSSTVSPLRSLATTVAGVSSTSKSATSFAPTATTALSTSRTTTNKSVSTVTAVNLTSSSIPRTSQFSKRSTVTSDSGLFSSASVFTTSTLVPSETNSTNQTLPTAEALTGLSSRSIMILSVTVVTVALFVSIPLLAQLQPQQTIALQDGSHNIRVDTIKPPNTTAKPNNSSPFEPYIRHDPVLVAGLKKEINLPKQKPQASSLTSMRPARNQPKHPSTSQGSTDSLSTIYSRRDAEPLHSNSPAEQSSPVQPAPTGAEAATPVLQPTVPVVPVVLPVAYFTPVIAPTAVPSAGATPMLHNPVSISASTPRDQDKAANFISLPNVTSKHRPKTLRRPVAQQSCTTACCCCSTADALVNPCFVDAASYMCNAPVAVVPVAVQACVCLDCCNPCCG